MACAPTGEEGTEAGREAEKRRRANTTNDGEIVWISGYQMGWGRWAQIPPPQFASLKTSSSILPVLVCLIYLFFRILGAKSTTVVTDISEQKKKTKQNKTQELLLNYYSKYCRYTFRTFTNIKILHYRNQVFISSLQWHSWGKEWIGLVSQMGCYSPISVRALPEPRPLFFFLAQHTVSCLNKALPAAKS